MDDGTSVGLFGCVRPGVIVVGEGKDALVVIGGSDGGL